MMNYTSDSPSGRLASSSWRRRHSAWLLAPIFGFGLLSFIGFLYCAIRIRNAKWWRIAGVTAALSAVGWVLTSLFSESEQQAKPSGAGNSLASGYMLALWVGLIIYGVIVNRDYLRWRAGQTEANAWYNQPAGAGPAVGLAPPPAQPAPASEAFIHPDTARPLGVDTRAYFSPQPTSSSPHVGTAAYELAGTPSPATVDVNSADATAVASATGLDLTTAERVTRARDERRGFKGLDDLVAAAQLQPHELLRLSGRVTFGPFFPSTRSSSSAPPETPPPTPGPQSGRILDY